MPTVLSRNFFLSSIISDHDTFDTQRPFQALQCLDPQPVVMALGMDRGAWTDLPLPPGPQDTCVNKIDPVLAVELIEAADDIVRFAWARHGPFVGAIAGPFPPRDQRRHRPDPCFLGTGEWLRLSAGGQGIGRLGGSGASDRRIHGMTFPVRNERTIRWTCNYRLHTMASKRTWFIFLFDRQMFL